MCIGTSENSDKNQNMQKFKVEIKQVYLYC